MWLHAATQLLQFLLWLLAAQIESGVPVAADVDSHYSLLAAWLVWAHAANSLDLVQAVPQAGLCCVRLSPLGSPHPGMHI